MNLQQVSREDAAPVMARQFTESYPGYPQSPAEILAYEGHALEGAHEEHWTNDEGTVAIALFAPDETRPPLRIEGEVHTSDDANYPHAVQFAEERTLAVGTRDLSIWTRSDKSLRRMTLESRGYTLIQTAPSSKLDIEAFDESRFEAKITSCRYPVLTIAELAVRGFDWMPALYEATDEMARDVPDPHDYVQIPYEQYAERLKNPMVYDHRLMFVAMDGEQIIGYTRVTPYQLDPTLVATGLSGVLRAYRRQGVVTALKVRAILALRDLGFKWLRTENDVTNPMYPLNLDLGFAWEWDWLQFGKSLQAG
jgi:hypothetical protein